MYNIDAGTTTFSEKENLSNQTAVFFPQKNKSLFYEKSDFEIQTTSSAFENKTLKAFKDKTINTLTADETKPVKTLRSIYFGDDFISPELRNGFNLLEKSQTNIKQALKYYQNGKRKEADECIMEFKTFLPELFCCRNISESFGAIINSIHNALSNMKGQPLSENQIVALSNLVSGLLREPAMSFEKAVDYVSEFEDADFEVESAGLEGLLKLAEMMNED